MVPSTLSPSPVTFSLLFDVSSAFLNRDQISWLVRLTSECFLSPLCCTTLDRIRNVASIYFVLLSVLCFYLFCASIYFVLLSILCFYLFCASIYFVLLSILCFYLFCASIYFVLLSILCFYLFCASIYFVLLSILCFNLFCASIYFVLFCCHKRSNDRFRSFSGDTSTCSKYLIRMRLFFSVPTIFAFTIHGISRPLWTNTDRR